MISVEALWRYPVKSCKGHSVERAEVRPRGFADDRRWMIVDADGRHFTQRESGALALVEPRLSGDGVAFVDGPSISPADLGAEVDVTIWDYPVGALEAPDVVNAWLSERAGAAVRLVYMPDSSHRRVDHAYGRDGDVVSFADGYPYLIASLASLEDLNRRLPAPIPMRRFRPNIVLSGCGPFEEDTWKRVRIAALEFDVVKPCARCVVIDTDPDTGERRKGVLKTLSTYRRWDGQVYFGQNAIARGLGEVRVGDEVEVLARR
ncbi:MAG: MOSC domain-containing protein [Rhodothermales bacterium]|nr:MOSC domain-containing protein [Rhodothermales bacterium]MBO6780873.1 MOSC domain-containing protein [Rhodothermales bacterium]